MRVSVAVAGATFLAAAVAVPRAEPDPLANLRDALGGEAALAGVATVHAKGRLAQDYGGRIANGKIEFSCVLPDKFVRSYSTVTSLTPEERTPILPTPQPYTVSDLLVRPYFGDVVWQGQMQVTPVHTDGQLGVNAGAPIGFRPTRTVLDSPAKAATRAKDRAAWIARGNDAFTRFVLPLIARQPSTSGGIVATGDNALEFRDAEGEPSRLDLDPVTHLPARLTWTERVPIRIVDPRIETRQTWQTVFSDYGAVITPAGTVNWPRRMVTTRAGKLFSDVTIQDYQVNTTIKPTVFKTQ